MVDVKVTLTGGKAHSVDSSDMAFQSAGALALREAAASVGIDVLEPVDEIEVTGARRAWSGTVMGDLAARRGPGARPGHRRRATPSCARTCRPPS